MNGLILWGAGGHAKVVLDCALLSGCFSPIAFLDDAAEWEAGGTFCDHPVLGGREQLRSAIRCGYHAVLVAIGDNRIRSRCLQISSEHGLQPATIVHPGAVVSPSALLCPGTVVMPRAVINAGAVIGRDCIINSGAVLEHDVHIGDHAHISPGAVLGGAVRIADYVHVGIGAVILPGAEIGEGAAIGGGAVVLRSVAPRTTVAGVPAKLLTLVSA